jgi:hypothetical protein
MKGGREGGRRPAPVDIAHVRANARGALAFNKNVNMAATQRANDRATACR